MSFSDGELADFIRRNGYEGKLLTHVLRDALREASREILRREQQRNYALTKAVVNLIAACDANHDTKTLPQQYGVPYAEVNALRAALLARRQE